MATWPVDDLTKNHLDENTDSPLLGRPEIEALVDKLKTVLAAVDTASLANTLVKRNASGDFSANVITALEFVGNLTGDVSGNAGSVDTKHADNTANNLVVLDGSAKVPQTNLGKASSTVYGVARIYLSGSDLHIDTV